MARAVGPVNTAAAVILENTLLNSLRVKLIYLLIRLAGVAVLPVLLLYAGWRCLRQRAYWKGMKERLGWLPANIPSTKPGGIWLHAVSVGEVLSAISLLKHLREAVPETPVFVSTTTLTGRELAEHRLRGLCDGIFFAPVDYPFAVRAVLRRIEPALVIHLETEIWPNRIREVKRSGAKWAQVNARISDRAWPKYRRLQWLFGAVLPQMDFVAAQSGVDAARFRELGYAGEIAEAGNLKFDYDAAGKPAAEDVVAWLATQEPKPLWVAASTTGPRDDQDVDEDEAVLTAFLEMKGRVRLLLAPRRPERFEVVAGKLLERGIGFVRRSELNRVARADLLLLDTIGELAALFALADVVFVGGSFNQTQGHNILEPASFGKPILTGPNMGNFAAIQQEFLAADAVRVVGRAEDLGEAVLALLDDDAGMGMRAKRLAESMRGVTARLTPMLVQLLGLGVPKGLVPMAAILRPLSLPWSWISQRRVVGRRLPVPVVSVGNISMGGTGKTPVVLALAEHFAGEGMRVGILTRGYGRSSRKPVLLLPGETSTRAETGDEAQLYLRDGRFAVGIGADRYEVGLAMLERGGLDLILLDDGFQHRQLARDFDLVCVDALRPFAGYGVPPAGWLREPLGGLSRADAFVLTRTRKGVAMAGISAELARFGGVEKPVFAAVMEERIDELPAGRRLAFCGLGNPGSFRQSLDRMGMAEVDLVEFADHHEYSEADLRQLRLRSDALITTAKDAVKLDDLRGVFVVEQKVVLPVELLELMRFKKGRL